MYMEYHDDQNIHDLEINEALIKKESEMLSLACMMLNLCVLQ